MLMVKIFFKNGETDLKCCNDISEICLDGVERITVIRDDREEV